MVGATQARAHPDLSGTWTIDATRSSSTGGGQGGGRGTGGGLGLGPSADALTIHQNDHQIAIDERRGSDVAHLIFLLDGHSTNNPIAAGRNAGATAVSTTSWKDDRLVTTITAPAPPGSDVAMHYQEVRFLDRDGTLVVDTTIPGRPNARRVVYVRQKKDDVLAHINRRAPLEVFI